MWMCGRFGFRVVRRPALVAMGASASLLFALALAQRLRAGCCAGLRADDADLAELRGRQDRGALIRLQTYVQPK